jgi:hypothetical protein
MITWEHNRPCPYSPVNVYKRVSQTNFKQMCLWSYVGHILRVFYVEFRVCVYQYWLLSQLVPLHWFVLILLAVLLGLRFK